MAAIGGELTVKGSCVQCNNALNKAFEEQMARRLCHFHRVRTSRPSGRVAVIDVRSRWTAKRETRLMPDGGAQLKPVVTTIVKDGVKEIVGEHLTERQKEEWREKAKKGGWGTHRRNNSRRRDADGSF